MFEGVLNVVIYILCGQIQADHVHMLISSSSGNSRCRQDMICELKSKQTLFDSFDSI